MTEKAEKPLAYYTEQELLTAWMNGELAVTPPSPKDHHRLMAALNESPADQPTKE